MAAELVRGALLSATLQVLFDRLASREVVDYFRGNKLCDELINSLKIVLLAINAVLDDAEEKQITNPNIKQWLDELEAASYEADDLLDEIATHALQSKLEASGSRNSKRKESEFYCRDGDKEAIIKLLLKDDDKGSNKVSVIPIVGVGGVGKTTLAQSVYNNHKVQNHFNLKSWVYVSEEFDIFKVTRTVLSAVPKSHSLPYDKRNLDSLQTELKERLMGKKFLIVLDNVWNEDYVDWKNMSMPFKYGARGSKIIVTRHTKNVAEIMSTIPTHYQLKQLKDEDCWRLFKKHAFDNIRDDSSVRKVLETIGKQIIQKCNGLPLASKTLGGLLRSKEDVSEWERILKSDIWDFSYKESKILPALMLSYHYLPSHLKRCFAFCSLFPKGYKFAKGRVILFWMAENLLQ
nr:putative disease resistance RPP13-like protein 1 [Ziziphus jujuba var. spinosa]